MLTRSLRTALTVLLMTVSSLTAFAQDAPTGAIDPSVPSIAVVNAVVARALENRLPIASEEPYLADGERLYVYLEVANPDGPETTVTLNWRHGDGDGVSFTQTLDIGRSRNWRTWGYHRMTARTVGAWHVDVIGPDGVTLAQLDFTVTSASESEPAPSAQVE